MTLGYRALTQSHIRNSTPLLHKSPVALRCVKIRKRCFKPLAALRYSRLDSNADVRNVQLKRTFKKHLQLKSITLPSARPRPGPAWSWANPKQSYVQLEGSGERHAGTCYSHREPRYRKERSNNFGGRAGRHRYPGPDPGRSNLSPSVRSSTLVQLRLVHPSRPPWQPRLWASM